MAAKKDSKAEVPTTALAQVPTSVGLMSSSAPAWLQQKMQGQAPRGLEKLNPDDIIYPRLVLCQSNSPAVQDGKARIGDIIDNLAGEVLVSAGGRFPFIPIVYTKMRMFMVPFEEGGGILCRSQDALTARPGGCGMDQGGVPTLNCLNCIHKEWNDTEKDAKKRRPKCTEFANIVGLLPDHDMRPFVLSCKSTQMAFAKRLLSISATTGFDFFAHLFELYTGDDANAAGLKYKKWEFQAKGYVTEEMYLRAEKLYKSIKGKIVMADISDIESGKVADGEVVEKPAPF